MPIYEYRCGSCGEFEAMQRINDKRLTRCPTCRGKVTKLISSTSFQLKGDGWYATDYARKQNAPGTREKKDEEKKGEGKKDGEKKSTSKESGGTAVSDGGSGKKKAASDKVAAA